MKKTLSVLLSVCLMLTMCIVGASAMQDDGPSYGDGGILPGDVDLDGVITASDARLALRASVGLEELDAIAFDCADYNKDGTVSADDARSILRKSVGLDEEDVPPVEPEEPTVPVEPDEPTVPDEPDDPSVHKHSYVGCVCTCGDVQDGNFYTFLRNWIVSNHAYDESGEQFLFIEVTRPSGFSCLVSPSYNKETGQILLICQYEWDDHYWAVGIQIPHESDDVIVLGQLFELYDETTLYLITTGYTLISASEYEYGNTYYFDEYEGDDSYVDTLEDEVGFGVGIAIETLYEHLTEDCGYIFTYEDMGFPSFENGY